MVSDETVSQRRSRITEERNVTSRIDEQEAKLNGTKA